MGTLKSNYLRTAIEVLALSFLFMSAAAAQTYTFDQIKDILLANRAQSGDVSLRYECFRSIDDLILNQYPPLNPDTEAFYKFMIDKAFTEIQTENVTQGATVWQIYNHGFIVKTPSITIGFDLYDYYNPLLALSGLEPLLDIYFISHLHRDHFNSSLVDSMVAHNKPVVGPAEEPFFPIGMAAGEGRSIAGLQVTAHYGWHTADLRMFEVETQEGLKIIHTGDNTYLTDIPVVADLDIMLVNCWGSGGGISGMKNVIDQAHPKVLLPAHMMELGHLGSPSPPVPYSTVIPSAGDVFNADYHILGWGERYHYDDAGNDVIPPNSVSGITCNINDGNTIITWNEPPAAADGETASFYRIIINDDQKYFCTTEEYRTDEQTDHVKIYAYDACGNQSLNYTEYSCAPTTPTSPRIEIIH